MSLINQKKDDEIDWSQIFSDPEFSISINISLNEIYKKTTIIQKFKNDYPYPIELLIKVNKKEDILFDSFVIKIGKLKTAKSKVIEKNKGEEKYSDTISSGNAAIVVKEENDKYLINLGNIPIKEEVVFVSNYLNYIKKKKDLLVCDLINNLPDFYNEDSRITRFEEIIKAQLKLKSNKKITDIQGNIK